MAERTFVERATELARDADAALDETGRGYDRALTLLEEAAPRADLLAEAEDLLREVYDDPARARCWPWQERAGLVLGEALPDGGKGLAESPDTDDLESLTHAQLVAKVKTAAAMWRARDRGKEPPPGTQNVRLPVIGSVWRLTREEVEVMDVLPSAVTPSVRLLEVGWPLHRWHVPLDRFLAEAEFLRGPE